MKKIVFNLILLLTFCTVINTPTFANTTTKSPIESLSEKLDAAEKQPPKKESSLSVISLINRNSNYIVVALFLVCLVIVFYPNKSKKK